MTCPVIARTKVLFSWPLDYSVSRGTHSSAFSGTLGGVQKTAILARTGHKKGNRILTQMTHSPLNQCMNQSFIGGTFGNELVYRAETNGDLS